MEAFSRRLPTVLLAVAAAIAASACESGGPSAPSTPELQSFSVPSGSDPVAGGVLRLPRLDLPGVGPAELTATVGGEPSPLIVGADGDVRIVLPLYLDPDDLWFTAPSEPQFIELSHEGRVVARSTVGVQVAAPPEAPDATAEALADLSRRLDAFAAWQQSMTTPPGREEQHVFAVIEGLRAFAASEDEGSLRHTVASLSAEELRLVDALIAVSGTRDAFSDIADAAEDWAEDLDDLDRRPPRLALDLCGIPFPDTELAAMMQFSVMAKLFASNFLSGVAESASGIEASFATLTSITYLDKIPGVSAVGKVATIINAYFALLDLIANKYVTALMPTVIESITLSVDDPTLTAGETTESRKVICVRNDPPPFTITDIVGQVLNLVSLVGTPPEDVIERLENLGTTLLDRVNGFLGSYAADHPGVSLDVELTSMPEIWWTATIEDPDLLELMSSDPSVGTPLDDELEWRAPTGTAGSATVWCRPATGPDAIFVEDFLGISYGGAAFGFDVVASNEVDLHIDDLPALEVSFEGDDEDFYIDRPTSVRIRAGYHRDGSIEWAAGIQMTVSGAFGCTSSPTSGTTDANGYFDTDVTPYESEFSFETLALGEDGQDRDDEFGDYDATLVAFDFIGGSALASFDFDSRACSPSCGQSKVFYDHYDSQSQYGPAAAGASESRSKSDSGSFDSSILESPMTSMASAGGSASSSVVEGDDQVTLMMTAEANASAEFQDNGPDEPTEYWRWHARSKGTAGASRSLVVRGWSTEIDVSFTPPTSGNANLGPLGSWTSNSGFTSSVEWTETDDGFGYAGTLGRDQGFNFGISAVANAAVEKGTADPHGGGSDSQNSSGTLVVTIKLVPPGTIDDRGAVDPTPASIANSGFEER